jgi:hypothetical protein
LLADDNPAAVIPVEAHGDRRVGMGCADHDR